MKNLPAKLLIAALIFLAICTQAQTTVKLQTDGTYQTVSKQKAKAELKTTGQTYKDRSGKTYPIYKTEKGKLYVNRISAKTGNEYRYYLTLEN